MQRKLNMLLLIIILVVASLTSCNFPGLSKVNVDNDPDCSDEAAAVQELDDRCGELNAEATLLSGTATADMGIRLTDVANSGLKLTQAAGTEAANQPALTGPFGNARLEIDSSQATTEMKPLWGCQAPIGGYLIVKEDGTLEGVCDENLYGGNTIKHGTLSGKYDATANSVTFTLVTESTVSPHTGIEDGQYHTTETFVGIGSMVSANTATGQASFIWHCVVTKPSPVNNPPGETVGCNPKKDASFSMEGLVPFKLTFSP